MSADNGFVIRKHPDGGYTPVMYFASDDGPRAVDPKRDKSYPTPTAAAEAVAGEYTEYGTYFDTDVRVGSTREVAWKEWCRTQGFINSESVAYRNRQEAFFAGWNARVTA